MLVAGCGDDDSSPSVNVNTDAGGGGVGVNEAGANTPVGTWSETTNGTPAGTVTYKSDGTAAFSNGGTAKWTQTGSQVQAVGSFSGGAFTDNLTLSADGKTMSGQNTGGVAIVETRQ